MLIDATIDKNLAKAAGKVSLPEKSRAYSLCVKADALRFAKMYRESVQSYLQAIMADRREVKAYWGLAISYKYLKNTKSGLNTLLKLIEIDDTNDSYFFEIGVCYLSERRPEKAIVYLVKCILLTEKIWRPRFS